MVTQGHSTPGLPLCVVPFTVPRRLSLGVITDLRVEDLPSVY